MYYLFAKNMGGFATYTGNPMGGVTTIGNTAPSNTSVVIVLVHVLFN